MAVCNAVYVCSLGRWPDTVARSVDATREFAVSYVQHRIGCLEFWSRSLGDIHFRQTAGVRILES